MSASAHIDTAATLHGHHEPAVRPDPLLPIAAAVLDSAAIATSGAGSRSLAAYLEALGVEVRSRHLPAGMVGRTRMELSQVIEVDASASAPRRLFTVAHEVGHLLLEEASFDRRLRAYVPTGYADIERVCDRIAAQILLPDAWMLSRGLEAVHAVELDRALGEVGISATAFIIRLNEMGYPAVMAKAEYAASGWIARQGCGRLRSIRRRALPLSVLNVLPSSHTTYRGPAPVRPWRIGDRVCGEVTISGSTARVWFAGLEPTLSVNGAATRLRNPSST